MGNKYISRDNLEFVIDGLKIGTQADWNENDKTASGYVRNRTHWEETNKITLVDNLTSEDYAGDNSPQCNFIPDQKYNVVWNGILYEDLVCWFDEGYNVIGNSEELPFYIDDDGGDSLYIEASEDEPWTISIVHLQREIYQINEKYIPDSIARARDVMNATNPVGTGSFSLNRKAGTITGLRSHAEGYETTASGSSSHAEGYETTASGHYGSHAEGENTIASGRSSHAEGANTEASGNFSHAEGTNTEASGVYSHAEGANTTASGDYSHTEGSGTRSNSRSQNVIGEYNITEELATYIQKKSKTTSLSTVGSLTKIYYSKTYSFNEETGKYTLTGDVGSNPDSAIYQNKTYYFINGNASGATMYYNASGGYASDASLRLYAGAILYTASAAKSNRSIYAHIIGNGTSSKRSNAHTLDWDGNAWYQGDVYVGSTSGTNKDEGSKKLATEEYVDAVSALVGDTSVADQISTAIAAKADLANGQYYVTASTSDGAAYTATVPGITALTAGISFIMIPAAVSTTKGPTLNVNGLGAKYIRRRLSSGATVDEGYTTTWLTKNKPFRVMYDGAQWIVEGHNKPVAADIYGTITATNDSDGNKIVDTYVTKTDWQNALPKSTSISILAASWTGSANPWSQVVTVNGVTANSKVDLQPTATQIIDLQNNGVALMTENNSGVITVYALGNKPTSDYTMQVLITETISV